MRSSSRWQRAALRGLQVAVIFGACSASASAMAQQPAPPPEVVSPRIDSTASAWAEIAWQVDPRLEITPGLRVDLFHSSGASAVGVDPRLGVRVDVTKRIRLLHALGIAHQPPSFIVPVPGLALASLRGRLQRSLQTAAGVEVLLPLQITATATLFNNIFLNMTDTAGVRPPGDDQNQVPRSLGVARGLEVYVRRNLTQQLGGLLSYTLSRSTRTLGAYTFPYAFDRTHVLNAALGYDLFLGTRGRSRSACASRWSRRRGSRSGSTPPTGGISRSTAS